MWLSGNILPKFQDKGRAWSPVLIERGESSQEGGREKGRLKTDVLPFPPALVLFLLLCEAGSYFGPYMLASLCGSFKQTNT